MNMTLL